VTRHSHVDAQLITLFIRWGKLRVLLYSLPRMHHKCHKASDEQFIVTLTTEGHNIHNTISTHYSKLNGKLRCWEKPVYNRRTAGWTTRQHDAFQLPLVVKACSQTVNTWSHRNARIQTCTNGG